MWASSALRLEGLGAEGSRVLGLREEGVLGFRVEDGFGGVPDPDKNHKLTLGPQPQFLRLRFWRYLKQDRITVFAHPGWFRRWPTQALDHCLGCKDGGSRGQDFALFTTDEP